MSEGDVEGFLAAFASAAEAVEVTFRWRPQLSDPKDELVLEAAVNGEADALALLARRLPGVSSSSWSQDSGNRCRRRYRNRPPRAC